MTKAVFPGTFDPPTYGHLDMISRGIHLFDTLDVLVALNPEKTPCLSSFRRRDLLKEQIAILELEGVEIRIWEGLVADYCRKAGAGVLLRGVRSINDFQDELELSILNRHLGMETVLLPTDPQFLILRSRNVMELVKSGCDVSAMVPPEVELALKSFS